MRPPYILRPQEQFEAIQAARQRQHTQEFKKHYAIRAGIEGTISQGVRAFDLRRSRYIGLARTYVQYVITATAINLSRLLAALSLPLWPSHATFAKPCNKNHQLLLQWVLLSYDSYI